MTTRLARRTTINAMRALADATGHLASHDFNLDIDPSVRFDALTAAEKAIRFALDKIAQLREDPVS